MYVHMFVCVVCAVCVRMCDQSMCVCVFVCVCRCPSPPLGKTDPLLVTMPPT